jgi:CRISPR-associated protein Cas2
MISWVRRVLVVIANDLPPAVRGRMKLWFIEPKANVFVSGIKDSLAEKVIDYLYKHCPIDSGVILFRSLPLPPGYEIRAIGPTLKPITQIAGLQLIVESLKNI